MSLCPHCNKDYDHYSAAAVLESKFVNIVNDHSILMRGTHLTQHERILIEGVIRALINKEIIDAIEEVKK